MSYLFVFGSYSEYISIDDFKVISLCNNIENRKKNDNNNSNN